MPYLTVDEFKVLLRTKSLELIVQDQVFEGDPYVFRNTPSAYAAFRQHLSERIGTLAENIVVVGSAKTGFSLSPDGFPRPFY